MKLCVRKNQKGRISEIYYESEKQDVHSGKWKTGIPGAGHAGVPGQERVRKRMWVVHPVWKRGKVPELTLQRRIAVNLTGELNENVWQNS